MAKMSDSVMMPMTWYASSTTGRPLTRCSSIIRAASAGNKAGALTALGELLRAREGPLAIAAAPNNNNIKFSLQKFNKIFHLVRT